MLSQAMFNLHFSEWREQTGLVNPAQVQITEMPAEGANGWRYSRVWVEGMWVSFFFSQTVRMAWISSCVPNGLMVKKNPTNVYTWGISINWGSALFCEELPQLPSRAGAVSCDCACKVPRVVSDTQQVPKTGEERRAQATSGASVESRFSGTETLHTLRQQTFNWAPTMCQALEK